jgi:5'-nucleotidase
LTAFFAQQLDQIFPYSYLVLVLVKFNVDGNRGYTCHKVLEYSGYLTQENLDNAKALHNKYYPMEIDPNLSREEKEVKMIEWCIGSHNGIVKAGLTKNKIVHAVSSAMSSHHLAFRRGVDSFFRSTTGSNIPVLLFSAGIGEVVEDAIIAAVDKVPSNIFVLSNRCLFAEPSDNITESGDCPMVAFAEPFIHVFNKRCSAFPDFAFFQCSDERQRRNVILLGDSMGDVDMVDGMVHDDDTIIKIGFLNDLVDERLEAYLNIYDVVLLGADTSFAVPQHLLSLISLGSVA